MDILKIDDVVSKKYLAENLKAYFALHPEETRESLADKAGTSKQQVYKLMKGEVPPTTDSVDRLAAAIGITASELLKEGYFDQFEKQIVKKKV